MGISFPWIRKRGGVIEGGKAQDGERGRGASPSWETWNGTAFFVSYTGMSTADYARAVGRGRDRGDLPDYRRR